MFICLLNNRIAFGALMGIRQSNHDVDPANGFLKLFSRNKAEILVFFVYLFIALVMFWNITVNIVGSLPSSSGASYQSAWGLWWINYATFMLHQNPYFTNYILYPVGANLGAQSLAPVAAILTWPLQQISIAFAYNILFFLGFALSGLFMYMLAKYMVKNKYAAFIAGLVFAFAPVHIAQAYTQLQWTSVEFIPLFALLLIMTIREKHNKYRNAIFAGLSFFMLTFFGDVLQGAMMLFFAVASVVLLFIIERRTFTLKTAKAIALLFVVAAIICSPLIAASVSAHGQGSVSQQSLNDIPHEMLFSDTLSSYFLPSYYNGLFGTVSKSYYNNTYGLNYSGINTTAAASRKVSYIGYTVIALAALGAVFAFRKERTTVAYLGIVFFIFAILALGPVFQATGSMKGSSGPINIGINTSGGNVTGLPLPYVLYRDIPAVNVADQPGAFDIIAEMAIAVLAAFGVEGILSKGGFGKNALAFVVLVAALILVEYNGMPLSGYAASQLTVNATVPVGFAELGNLTGNFSVLQLPALPATNGSFNYPGMAMLYSTSAKRQLVGGYAAVMNQSQQTALESIPLVVQSTYLQGGQGFLYPYPINENYSNLTLIMLAEYKVGFVSIFNNAFSSNDSTNLVNYLESVFGPYPYRDSQVTIFRTSNAIEKHLSSSALDAYVIGNWVPGYLFCVQQCSSEFAAMWWGNSTRAVVLYSSRSGTAIMKTDSMSYYRTDNVAVIDNGKLAGFINATNDTSSRQIFNITLNVTDGLNQILFYEPNSTLEQYNPKYAAYPYFNFGLYNMSFAYSSSSSG